MNKNTNPITTIEALGKEFLPPKVEQSFPDIEVEIEEFSGEITVKEFAARVKVKGFSGATFLVSLLTLIVTFVAWIILLLK